MYITGYKIRKVLNSRAEWIDEYVLLGKDGMSGVGSAPRGETLSEREIDVAKTWSKESNLKVSSLLRSVAGSQLTQAEFDECLLASDLSSVDIFALSSAFFDLEYEAGCFSDSTAPDSVRFCFNVVNGGKHAYTNAVHSDFHEILLVPPHQQPSRESIADYLKVNNEIADRLKQLPTVEVAGNQVACPGDGSNRDVIAFVDDVRNDARMADNKVMIDVSGTDLWKDNHYLLEISEGKKFEPEEFVDYWLELIESGNVNFLEDPFHEHDLESWSRLAHEQNNCVLVGDNLHSGDVARFTELAKMQVMGAVMLKPDQAMTVSATNRIIEEAQCNGIEVILSHRSISTDSAFLGKYMLSKGLAMAKFGPLLSDFSAILKMNQVFRYMNP